MLDKCTHKVLCAGVSEVSVKPDNAWSQLLLLLFQRWPLKPAFTCSVVLPYQALIFHRLLQVVNDNIAIFWSWL